MLGKGEAREKGVKFAENFTNATEVIGNRARLGKLAGLFRNKQFDDEVKFIHEYIQVYVRKALEQKANPEKTENASKYVFLEHLAMSENSSQKIQAELLNILVAGRDTTAGTLAHLWYTLARRPDVFEKLRAEVLRLEDREPSFEQIKEMKYLQYCLNETLRLYPMYGTSPFPATLERLRLPNL